MNMQPFAFAGFQFPRAIAQLPKGSPRSRLGERRYCGPYITAPTPNRSGGFFYLGSDFSPERWRWADDVAHSIRHRGWFTDDYCDDTIRGLVVYLPHGRMLAGWSMGEGMASEVDAACIYDDEVSAALAADSMAERAAERERDYQAQQRQEGEK